MLKKEKHFSRKKLSALFTAIFILMFSVMAYADTATAAPAENVWLNNGWSRIHENEAFNGEKNLLRGEFATLINSLLNFKDQTEISFTDVNPDTPYFKEVSKAFKAGYILGRGNNKFYPEAEITKAEAYIMIARALKLDTSKPVEQLLKFSDATEVPSWASKELEALTVKGILGDKNKVKPFEKLTGQEAIALLQKIKQISSSQTQTPPTEPQTPATETKGNGNSPLNFLGAYFVKVENNTSTEINKLADGFTSENMIIKLVFDRGVVRDNWENNQTQISLRANNGSTIKSEVFRIENSDAEKEFIFIKPLETLKSGKTVNIVIGKDLKANNGNTLGTETVISFVVK